MESYETGDSFIYPPDTEAVAKAATVLYGEEIPITWVSNPYVPLDMPNKNKKFSPGLFKRASELMFNMYYTIFGDDLRFNLSKRLPYIYTKVDFKYSIDLTQQAEAITTIGKNSLFQWYFEDTLVLCENPEIIHFDGDLVHNATGPAIRFSGGLEFYFWKGTAVPKEWILDPSSLDPRDALYWNNSEQRRCATEIMGWKKIIDYLHPRVIDQNADPVVGTLLEVIIGDRLERFLQVLCGTGRTFCLPVPPEMKTAQEAQNWIWQWDPGLPKPEIRT